MPKPTVFLIPTILEEQALHTIPTYVLDTIRQCQTLFVEQERTARRFLKALDKSIDIQAFNWFTIHKAETDVMPAFRAALKAGETIGIISEAGCPGIADPGQILVAAAQEMGAIVRPLVGPSSILLALMASGMNGQQFSFHGYLPIDATARGKALKELESESKRKQSAHLFIETPYRNQALLEQMIQLLHPTTKLCIAAGLTGAAEQVQTKTVQAWKQQLPNLHKIPTLFIIQAG